MAYTPFENWEQTGTDEGKEKVSETGFIKGHKVFLYSDLHPHDAMKSDRRDQRSLTHPAENEFHNSKAGFSVQTLQRHRLRQVPRLVGDVDQ